ncbi:MAG: hypothetical protein JF597_25285 [Streptomyces sp.]|nr:DUF6271 family protein [Streptomyces sp.]MBW8796789.1 hypothetical protein [Streptomyces sp.]
MRRICLTLPPRRPCAATITALAEQAAHVVAHCDVTVRVLILDPCAAPASGEHHGAVRRIPAGPCIVVCCFGEERRRDFPQSGFGRSAAAKRDIPLELVLPLVFSRGACTNPALSLALGCAPVDHELLSLGRLAAYAACHLTETLIAASIVVGPMRLHMCNIPSHGVREYMPLPLAIDTGGSDNWPIHLVHNASLLGVLRDRSVVGEGGTVSRFVAYQLRHVEVLLPMLYANLANDPMVRSGASLLDAQRQVRTSGVARPARHSMRFDRSGDVPRLDVLDTAFRKLRNRYVQLADLDRRREYVLAEARSGVEDFAPLTEGWELLIGAARRTCVLRTPGQRR